MFVSIICGHHKTLSENFYHKISFFEKIKKTLKAKYYGQSMLDMEKEFDGSIFDTSLRNEKNSNFESSVCIDTDNNEILKVSFNP